MTCKLHFVKYLYKQYIHLSKSIMSIKKTFPRKFGINLIKNIY